MSDGLARFHAHFDSECDRCFRDIFEGDPMAYDKIDDQYICETCADELT